MGFGGIQKKVEDEFTLYNLYKNLGKLEKQIIMRPKSENSSSDNWSMVVIKDNNEDPSVVFPPTHHENLHLKKPPSISNEELQKKKPHSSSSSSSSSSSRCSSPSSTISDADDYSSSAIVPFSPTGGDDKDLTRNGFMDRVYFRLEALIEKVKGIIRKPSVFMSVVLLGFVIFQQKRLNFHRRRRTMLLEESREKDQRINQLLNQITRMNEVMVLLQRNSVASIKK